MVKNYVVTKDIITDTTNLANNTILIDKINEVKN